MMKPVLAILATVPACTMAIAAAAQETPPEAAPAPAITVSGSATLASDYRFRGISQSDRHMAVQGGITVSHASGAYVGGWAANLAGWGTFGGANMELDLIAGYKAQLSPNAALDVGLTWYLYPGGADKSDFAEPYAKLTGTAGPATLTAGIAYAPRQQALGRWYNSGADAAAGVYTNPGARDDNLYLWGDAAVAISGTPFAAKAHIGHSQGNPGLGPNGTSVTPTGHYWDWSVGVDTRWRSLILGVAYLGTDITGRDAAYLQPGFSRGQDATGSIAGDTALLSLTAAF